MSNKITLATIQFRADAKGANAALESLRKSSKDAHDEVDRLQAAFDKGTKTMKDINGVEFNVESKLKAARREAKNFDQAIRELMKGATALEEVVKNIRLGEIERSSRAELKGAINAAEARKRSVRETDPEDLQQQRELNIVIEESRKQLNNLDRDTQKVIETLDKGGVIAQATLDKEIKGLKEILTLVPKGSEEWNKYNQQLQQMETHVANIRRQEREAATALLGSKDFGQYSEEQIRTAITNARELLSTYKTASPEAKALAENIVRAEQHLKEYGVEAARSAAREKEQLQLEQELAKTMNLRLRDLKNLSADALTETRKYWEAQRNGAAEGTIEFDKAEKALKRIDNLQKNRRVAELDTILGDPRKFGVAEVRQAVQEMEKLRDSVQKGIPAWQHYNKMVNEGKAYLDQLAKSEAAQRINEQMSRLSTLSTAGLQEVKKYWETMVAGAEKGSQELRDYEAELKKVVAEEQNRKEYNLYGDAQKVFGNRSVMSETELRRAVEAAKEYQQTLMVSGSLHQKYSRAIAETEEYLKQYSVEAERARVKQEALDKQMRDRMHDLPKLSESALQETKKYWEDMMRTQGLAEQKLSAYRIQLEKLIAEERRRKEVQAERVIGNLNTSSDEEIRKAIQAFEQLRDAQAHGNDEWRYYNERVQEGKRYLDEWAKTDSIVKFEAQMQSLPRLSDAALQETKKFWETMVAGAEKGSQELRDYEAHLENVKREERERNQLANEQKAQRLSGDLNNYSEQEIREAIEAGKQLVQTYKTADPAAQQLAEKIAVAEQHLKHYGVEAARTAQKQKENIDLMVEQYNTDRANMSDSALKAHERFWQQLIDDPKTAAESLDTYRRNLAVVQSEIERRSRDKIQTEGSNAFDFFNRGDNENASIEEVKKQAKALKAYRDSLPQKTHAKLIEEIDALLLKAGQDAKKAAQDTMPLRDAYKIAMQGLQGSFKGTNEQLKQAKKTLEEQLAVADKGSKRYYQLQRALNGIALEEKRVAEVSKEVQAVLDKPKGRSFNELKQAVEQGRLKLQSMDRTTKEGQKAFDELAKKIKAADLEMKQLGNSAKGTASAFDKAWSRLKTYVGLYVGAAVAMQKFTATMGDLMELSDKMGEVQKTTGFTADEVGRLSENLKKMDTRTSLTGLMELSASAGQLGLKTLEDVQGFTEAANKLMIALPEMGREAATEIMRVAIATGEVDKIRQQMQDGLIDGSSATAVAMEKIASTIDRLRASSASTAPEITDFVKRVGAVGAQSGITIDQVAALGSTVSSLGMRVEMSATALSRMIPAIRNNAFAVGEIIHSTEEDIKRRFAEGQGMSVILDLFKAIRERSGATAEAIEGDSDAVAERVEKMMEAAGFQDVMKELNQQGARAGIVFAGLSQNVEQLEYQLGVASEAYEENIAIQQEFDKMNETTAAKWERLKNAFEEMFVGDTAQRWLGGIIDTMRGLVDFISGNVGPALKGLRALVLSIATAWGMFKIGLGGALVSMGGAVTALKNLRITMGLAIGDMGRYIALQWQLAFAHDAAAKAAIRAQLATMGATKAMMANVVLAFATALLTAYMALKDWISGSDAATKAIGELNDNVDEETRKLDILVNHYHDANGNLDKRKHLLNEINQKYSQYLGFLLTDAENSNLVALAHERIAAALKAEMYERERAAGENKVRQDFREDLSENWKEFTDELREYGLNAEEVAQTRNAVQGFLSTITYDAAGQKFVYANGTKEGIINYMKNEHRSRNANLNDADAEEIIALWVYQYLESTFGDRLNAKALKDIAGVTMATNSVGKGWDTAKLGSEFRGDYADVYTDMLEQIGIYNDDVNGSIAAANKLMKENQEKMIPELKKQAETAINTIQNNLNATDEEMAQAYENLASAIEGLEKISSELPQIAEKEGQTSSRDISSYLTGLFAGNNRVDTQKVSDARARLHSLWSRINQQRNSDNGDGDDNGDGGGRGLYGNYDKRVDPYEQWDANALVKRREDMLKRVRALAGGADVQQVLSMDKKFMDEATRKGIKNMRDAIAWYNEERLKIQEELHSRNLTNEGQWMDPKKGRSQKPKTPESEEAIAELDRYYLERKERIEEARANEEMTEAEYNRRLDVLEQEHLERRSALRQTFTSKDKQFIQQFRQWWASVEELDEVSWETIEAEWLAAFERDRKYNDRAAQKDLTQMQAITVKQLKEIEAIIDKERPFNGITRNLQDNLTKMGLLFKDGVPEGDKFMEENTRRLTFLLKEAEDAYNLTFDQLAEDMRKDGLGAWADAIINSENADKEKRAVIAQLHEVYDAVQEAIKKEASLVKKQVEIQWNDALLPNGKSIKATYEAVISQLGVQQSSVSRANSLIGAGTASERVADRLAIKQMQIQLQMQEHYYNLVRKTGMQRIDDLKEQARVAREAGKTAEAERLDLDAKHATMSLNLSLAKEETELAKQREEIIARTEESQNRLYTSLREWAELLSQSVQSLFEASHAGDADYYNERAKLDLTGKGGPGAGTYVVIDNEGTSDARAHYEYLDEREALERQREIEHENAQAEAWKKLWDDLNNKMSEQITDWLNASLQNMSIDANTAALNLNTEAEKEQMQVVRDQNGVMEYQRVATEQNTSALNTLTAQLAQGIAIRSDDGGAGTSPANSGTPAPVAADGTLPEGGQSSVFLPGVTPGLSWQLTEEQLAAEQAQLEQRVQMQTDAAEKVRTALESSFQGTAKTAVDTDKKMTSSSQSTFAKMTQAANMYGIAYQAMSNANLSTTQKFEMMALQAVGNYAIGALTTEMASASAKAATDSPGVLGTLWKQLGWAAAPVFAIFTGLLGGLMGLASSKISSAKSQIAQATGASANAGKLTTGMLTYAEGNVNEFTDPSTLTPGRQYNVDGADGKTYRARYMGKGARTHITSGPEFHLVGEAGREAIIDAKTTRQIQMDEPGIWSAIQTLYRGGRVSPVRRRSGRGMAAYADGNVEDFEEMGGDGIAAYGTGAAGGMSVEQMEAFQASIDRNNELLDRALTEGIKGVFDVHGTHGLVNTYDKAKKEAMRHGERYT